MPVDYAEVLKDLEKKEAQLETELKTVRAAMPAIKTLKLMQDLNAELQKPLRGKFAGMGATKAIREYLKGQSFPLTSRQIMEGLQAGGWETNSPDPLGIVSATLSQMKDVVDKIGDGWKLKTMTVSDLIASIASSDSQRPS